jgi:hypothetical protein
MQERTRMDCRQNLTQKESEKLSPLIDMKRNEAPQFDFVN